MREKSKPSVSVYLDDRWLYYKAPRYRYKKTQTDRHWVRCQVGVEDAGESHSLAIVLPSGRIERVPLGDVTKMGRCTVQREESLRFLSTEGESPSRPMTPTQDTSPTPSKAKATPPQVEYRYGAIGWFIACGPDPSVKQPKDSGGPPPLKTWTFAASDDDTSEVWMRWLRSYSKSFTSVPHDSPMLRGVPDVAPIEGASEEMADIPEEMAAPLPLPRRGTRRRAQSDNQSQLDSPRANGSFGMEPREGGREPVISLRSSRRALGRWPHLAPQMSHDSLSYSTTGGYVPAHVAHAGESIYSHSPVPSEAQSHVISHPMPSMRLKSRGRGSLAHLPLAHGSPHNSSQGMGRGRWLSRGDSIGVSEHSTPQGQPLALAHVALHASVFSHEDEEVTSVWVSEAHPAMADPDVTEAFVMEEVMTVV